MTTKKTKPRLGRGLSGLIAQPVQVEPKQNTNHPSAPARTTFTADAGLDRGDASRSGLVMIAVGDVSPNPFQPRKGFSSDSIAELAGSIKRSGMLQPIAVRVRGDGGWEIVAGERRWRAAQIAGLSSIPALVCEATDREAAEYALVENLQREDLNPIERARAFQGLIERFGLSQSEVAQGAGVARASVANILRILELETEIQDLIRDQKLSVGHAKALLSVSAGATRVALAMRIVAEEWSVRRAEESGAKIADRERPRGTKPKAARRVAEVERQLSEHLSTKVQVRAKGNGHRGVLMIEFYDLDQFDGLMERLGFSMRS